VSFRFRVRRATRIAGVYTVDGTLEDGEIRHGATASVQTLSRVQRVIVKTVAFVTPTPRDRKDVTITIAPPSFPFESLNGATIVGDD
jgi:hypothetical protein